MSNQETSSAKDSSPELSTSTSRSLETNNAQPENVTVSPAHVPDVLLSLAKDDRYIFQIITLLSECIVPITSVLFPSNPTNGSSRHVERELIEDNGQKFLERIQPELHLLASVLVHSAAFIFYTRRFGDAFLQSNDSAVVKRSIGMESLNLAYDFGRKRPQLVVDSKFPIGARIKASLLRASSSVSIDRWQSLLLFQTIIPYLIQRAGRGGWSKDLGEIASSFFGCYGGTRLGTVESDDADILNDDRLRGSARRRLFEAQRRQMMNYVRSVGEDEDAGDVLVHNRNEFSMEDETATSGSANNNSFLRRAKIAADFSWEFLRRASLAISSLSHGAHTLARQGGTTADSNNFDRYTKLLKWLLRLHLALFYWNGTYPTINHRIVGAKIRDNIPPSNPNGVLSPNAGVLVANRPTYKPVAILIVMQAATALMQTGAETLIELVHNIHIALFRWRRQRSRSSHQQPNVWDAPEREVYLDLVEERVPSIASAKDEDVTKQKKKRGKQNRPNASIHPCGICLNERVHPATSSACGHVFCWNCILHWVSNVRAECPLCRAQTRPQDVLPLYNFS